MQVADRRWWVLAVMSVGTIIVFLDDTIVNTALPRISIDLGASTGGLQWVVDAYVLVLAGLLLLCGSLGDRFGRKRAMSIGLILFAAASAGAGLSGSLDVLVTMRCLQGLGAALVLPATLSIITNVFPRRARPSDRSMDRGRWRRRRAGPGRRRLPHRHLRLGVGVLAASPGHARGTRGNVHRSGIPRRAPRRYRSSWSGTRHARAHRARSTRSSERESRRSPTAPRCSASRPPPLCSSHSCSSSVEPCHRCFPCGSFANATSRVPCSSSAWPCSRCS